MNKKQFLDEIKQKLRGLEESDVKNPSIITMK